MMGANLGSILVAVLWVETVGECHLESLHKLRKMLDKSQFVVEVVETAAKLVRSLAPLLSVEGADMVSLVIAAVVVWCG